jgi:hypothetical protein
MRNHAPMPRMSGRRVSLSLPRRWVVDLMRAGRTIPVATVVRRISLSEVMEARSRVTEPPPWPALFIKAYALVAARNPVLRQAYFRHPWPHLYEADESLASVAIARPFDGEPAVFFGLIHAPDQQPLRQLAGHFHDFRTKPVDQIRPFARLIRYTRYPLPIRRLLWWLGMNLSGRHRAKTVGTFGLSTVGSLGAGIPATVSPTATTLTYGPFGADGAADVWLHFDHRVLDGATAAVALTDLETMLRTELVRELDRLSEGTYNSAAFGLAPPSNS